ncbi:hypothetical protein DFH09DRAFT_1440744 [Mycena vulgaris]|nr:hypothetical protein DFH09DRAFT_1440744 [Mycena vulgaris]
MSFNNAPLSPTDRGLLDSLSVRLRTWSDGFPQFIYSPACIRANAAMFLDNEWIKVSELRDFRFLSRRDPPVPVSFPPLHVPPTRVKQETVDSRFAATPIKLEIEAVVALVRTRTLQDGGREVVEILSDSEDDSGTGIGEDIDLDSVFEVAETLFRSASRSSSIPASFPTSDSEDESGQRSSNTIWQDPRLTWQVLVGRFRVTTAVTVDRVEYLSKNSFNLAHSPLDSSYGQVDPKTGLLYTVDHLIKNHNNDSWKAAVYELDPTWRDAVFTVGKTRVEPRERLRLPEPRGEDPQDFAGTAFRSAEFQSLIHRISTSLFFAGKTKITISDSDLCRISRVQPLFRDMRGADNSTALVGTVACAR